MSERPEAETDDPNLLAGEYVLGVLDHDARREAERRLAADPAFARDVAAWSERLGPLLEEIAPVSPPEHVWAGVAAALAPPAAQGELQNRTGFWRAWALVSTGALAASLVAVALLIAPPASPGPPKAATLVADGGAVALSVTYDPVRRIMIAAPTRDLPAARGSAELWLIGADGKPKPLGLLDPARPAAMRLPEPLGRGVVEKAVLAVSLEPRGGSPTGLPTGPVVAKGAILAL